MKGLSTPFLTLSLLVLTAGTAWSEEPLPLPITPVEQTLAELRKDLKNATLYCQKEINDIEITTGVYAQYDHFWKTPHPWLNPFTCWGKQHHAACKKLDSLKLDEKEFNSTMAQFKDFAQTFEAKATKNINDYQAKVNKNETVPPIKTFAQEAKGEIGALGAGCKNMSNGLQKKLYERLELIHQLYPKKTGTPPVAKP